MTISVVRKVVEKKELVQLAKNRFGDLIKTVVDIKLKIMAIGGELHADAEALLLEKGSCQRDLWGINLYPDKLGDDFIEFDSMINLRPSQGNRSRGIDSPSIRDQVKEVVTLLVKGHQWDTNTTH